MALLVAIVMIFTVLSPAVMAYDNGYYDVDQVYLEGEEVPDSYEEVEAYEKVEDYEEIEDYEALEVYDAYQAYEVIDVFEAFVQPLNTGPGYIFVLANYLSDVNVTSLDNIPALQQAGGAVAITPEGYIAVTSRTANWNGIDILHSAVGFEAGDVVTVQGRVGYTLPTAWSAMILNTRPGAWYEAFQGDDLSNFAPGGSFTMNLTLTDANITDLTGASPAGIRIQTNGAVEMDFFIDNITVYRPVSDECDLIYSLAHDAHIQGLAVGATGTGSVILGGTPYLQQSGEPTFTIVAHPTSGGNSIEVSGRTADWNALDIMRGPMDMDPDVNEYLITIRGRVVDPPSGTQVILGGPASPWNWLGNIAPAADGSFELAVDAGPEAFAATAGGAAQFANAFRLQTNNSATFIVDDIEIELVALGGPIEPPPDEGDETDIWRLSTDIDVQALALNATFNNVQLDGISNHLQASDSPIFTIVESPEGMNAIQVTNRPADTGEWFGLDILFSPLNLVPGATYEFRASGRIVGAAPAGAAMQFSRPREPWGAYPGQTATLAGGEWTLTLSLSDSALEQAILNQRAVRIATNGAGRGMSFIVDEIEVVRIGDEPVIFNVVHGVTFDPASWETYENYISAGAQMQGTRVTNHGQDDTYAFRLENITGDYTSGGGNYLRFDLPEPLPLGSVVQISWYIYVPSAENPDVQRINYANPPTGPVVSREIVGPGLNINGVFGSAAHQPTNTQPVPDLNRSTPMDEWFNTTVEFVVDTTIASVDHLIFRFRVNNNVQQPSVYYIDNIQILLGGAQEIVTPEWDLTLPSLAETFAPWFLFGNIYPGTTSAVMSQFNTREAFLHHFNAITAENHHKPDAIAGPGSNLVRPAPEDFNFAQTDAIVEWAIENDITLVGHAFVWHSQSPNWMFRTTNAAGQIVPLTRAEARDNMEFYIRTLSEHFAAQGTLGAFYSWDVANEVIVSGGGSWGGPLNDWNAGDWRTQLRTDSPWYLAYDNNLDPQPGDHASDFIYDAFVFARRYFPYSILYYNDYNEEVPAKRNAIGQMVEQLNERWAYDMENNPEAVPAGEPYTGRLLVEGIGMQSHYHMGGWTTNINNVRPAIERFVAATGRVSITELDLTVFFHGGTTPPRPTDQIPAYFAAQADVYARLFGYYLEFADYIPRVSIWGLADHQSWRAVGLPVLFDSNFDPKPAFHAILDVAANATAPTIEAPVITTTDAPNGEIGERYTTQLTATRNNHSPMLWHVNPDDLPPGLRLHATTGVIEGVPTQNGVFTFIVTAENMGGSTTQEITIVIGEELVQLPLPPQLPPQAPPQLPTAPIPEPSPPVPQIPWVRWQPTPPDYMLYDEVADDPPPYYILYDEADGDGTAVLSIPIPQPPATGVNRLIFTVGNAEYLLNGQLRTSVGTPFIDPATDRMMIPLRTLAEATGAEVDWCSDTRSAIVYLSNGDVLTLPVDQPLPDGMGMPLFVNDRVFVPLRFVMYALNKTVEWDSQNRAGIISW